MKLRLLRLLSYTSYAVAAAMMAATSQPAIAADAPPSAASFFKDPAISFVSLSPQGGYVALVTKLDDGRQALAVRDTADLKKLSVPVTASSDAKIVAVHWINESRLGFTFKNYRTEFESNLDKFAVDRDGSNLTRLISGNWQHRQNVTGSNITDKVLTADYAFFDITHDGSDDIIVARYIWNGIDMHPDASQRRSRKAAASPITTPRLATSGRKWSTSTALMTTNFRHCSSTAPTPCTSRPATRATVRCSATMSRP